MTARAMIGLAAVAMGLLSACTYDSAYGRGDGYPYYAGGSYGRRGIGGTGAKDLDPWLSGTRAGTVLVLARFDRNYNGEIGSGRAGEANRWFRRYADTNRDLRLTDEEIGIGLDRVMRELAGR